MDVLINFVNHLDPNGVSVIDWPAYTAENPALLTLLDGNTTQEITEDTYREEGMQAIFLATIATSDVDEHSLDGRNDNDRTAIPLPVCGSFAC